MEQPDSETGGVDPDLVVPYLAKYGYKAADLKNWAVPPNVDRAQAAGGLGAKTGTHLELVVTGHDEREGHTWYNIDCPLLLQGGQSLTWQASRRLVQLREGLHDPLKRELADAYKSHFKNASFAHRGGLPGTTARLKDWCGALATCVNRGVCAPGVVGLTLEFLEAPEPPSLVGNAKKAASTMADKVRGKIEGTKNSLKERVERTQMQYTETATEAGMNFAKQNPKLAQMGGSFATSFARQNPEMAQSVGKAGGQAAFKMMKQNPQMAMSALQMTVKTAARTM